MTNKPVVASEALRRFRIGGWGRRAFFFTAFLLLTDRLIFAVLEGRVRERWGLNRA